MQKKSSLTSARFFSRLWKNRILLFIIILIAFYFRTFNINWDSNFYFHPDERAIVMFTAPMEFPTSFLKFFSVESPLNPHFFAYGNFPLYVLRLASELAANFNPLLKEYGGMHIIGRLISALCDTATVLVVYLIASRFSKNSGIIASFLYAVAVYPIQLSHYFAVDTILTLFMTLTLWSLIRLIEKPNIKRGVCVGVLTGLSLATKISSLIIGLDILFVILLIFQNFSFNFKEVPKLLKIIITIAIFALFFFSITQPYVLIDYKEFIEQTNLQSQMAKNAFIFPYTLQYVGKTPYLYELKNIFLWGMGPITSLFSFLGLIILTYQLIKKRMREKHISIILLFYFYSYFVLFGSFAVGWMRYMLPIYPLLTIFGGFLISEIIVKKIPKEQLKNAILRRIYILIFAAIILIYPISYLSIYLKPNTRIQASNWMQMNIPIGSNIAVEHWDDALPVGGSQNYNQLTLPLYEPDTTSKWTQINEILKKTDYIIIASNRLYVPLQKLTRCEVLPAGRCYKKTAQYYKNLFNGSLGFKKVAQFTENPTIPLLNIKIVDDAADESFTVSDHPKVMIFKKIVRNN